MSRKRDNWLYRHKLKWGEWWHGAELVSWAHHYVRVEGVLFKQVRYARFGKRKKRKK